MVTTSSIILRILSYYHYLLELKINVLSDFANFKDSDTMLDSASDSARSFLCDSSEDLIRIIVVSSTQDERS